MFPWQLYIPAWKHDIISHSSVSKQQQSILSMVLYIAYSDAGQFIACMCQISLVNVSLHKRYESTLSCFWLTLVYHITNSANQNSSCKHEAELKASIKITTVILFCKHTALYILRAKFGLAVKGHSVLFKCFVFFCYLENQFWGTWDSIHSCHILRSALVTS